MHYILVFSTCFIPGFGQQRQVIELLEWTAHDVEHKDRIATKLELNRYGSNQAAFAQLLLRLPTVVSHRHRTAGNSRACLPTALSSGRPLVENSARGIDRVVLMSDSGEEGGISSKLKTLADLRASGALTQEEYETAKSMALAEENGFSASRQQAGRGEVIDVVAFEAGDDLVGKDQTEVDNLVGSIVRQEMLALAEQNPEELEKNLPNLLGRVEQRAVEASKKSGYQFGDITKTVVESTRGEIQRQLEADWTSDDVGLLLKIALFLGAGAAAPVAGFAALPAAALISTYGAVLQLELGGRAVQELGTRVAERAKDDIAQSVRDYTGKDEYRFGDVTEATVRKVTGSNDYKFGDITRNAVKSVTGKDEYKFGDISKSLFKKLTGDKKTDKK